MKIIGVVLIITVIIIPFVLPINAYVLSFCGLIVFAGIVFTQYDKIQKVKIKGVGTITTNPPKKSVDEDNKRFFQEITGGSITYTGNSADFKPLNGLKMSIKEGYLKLNEDDTLVANVLTVVPIEPLQKLNERLGLDDVRLTSESNIISKEVNKPTVFTSVTEHVLPQGERVLDLNTWQEVELPISFHVTTQTTVSGYVKGRSFEGTFQACLIYTELGSVTINGNFQAFLA